MDKLEAHFNDLWPTKKHMQTGRSSEALPYHYHAVKPAVHLKRLEFDVTKRSTLESIRSKPKKKQYQLIDKKNLLEL
jgi:hypothetical protein